MYADCERPEFYSTKEYVARKVHECCECSAPIVVGEKYFYCIGKWDGEISCHKQHLLCEETCEFIRDCIEKDCIGFGCLKEWWDEYKQNCDVNYHKHKDEDLKKLRGMLVDIHRRERSVSGSR